MNEKGKLQIKEKMNVEIKQKYCIFARSKKRYAVISKHL